VVRREAGLPAAVHPQPLRGVLPDCLFDHRGKPERCSRPRRPPSRRCRRASVRGEAQDVLALRLLPQQEAGQDAAPVLSATRASPEAVHASMPKKGTKSPCGGVMLVSIRMPTSRPRASPRSGRARSRPCAGTGCRVAADRVHQRITSGLSGAESPCHRVARSEW